MTKGVKIILQKRKALCHGCHKQAAGPWGEPQQGQMGLQLQKALAKPPAKALLLASWPDAAPCSGHTLSHPCRHRAGGTPATTTRWYWPVSSAAMPPQGHVTKTSPSRERKRGREGQKEGRKEWREGGKGGREEKREGEETEKGVNKILRTK